MFHVKHPCVRQTWRTPHTYRVHSGAQTPHPSTPEIDVDTGPNRAPRRGTSEAAARLAGVSDGEEEVCFT